MTGFCLTRFSQRRDHHEPSIGSVTQPSFTPKVFLALDLGTIDADDPKAHLYGPKKLVSGALTFRI